MSAWRTRTKGTKKQKGLKFQTAKKQKQPFKLKATRLRSKAGRLKTEYEIEQAIKKKGQTQFTNAIPPMQLKMGIKVEMEHTDDPKIAEQIAKDHLREFPDYYTRLLKMEAQAKRERKSQVKRLAPTALMDIDRRAASRLQRDPDTYKLEDVPISQINLEKAWNEHRYKDNKYYLRVTGGMPPVLLHFDGKTGKFNIEDGIHRIHAAKDLGYVQVPAIVAYV